MSTTKETKEPALKSPLREGVIVTVKPIPHQTGYLYDNTGRPALPGSRTGFKGIPKDPTTRRYNEPLSDSERKWFETVGGFDTNQLLANNPKGKSWWTKYSITLRNDETMNLRLGDTGDYLRWAFIKAQSDIISPSWADRHGKQTYSHALVDLTVEKEEKATKIDKQLEASMFLGEIKSSIHKMKAFLNLYLKATHSTKRIPISPSSSFLLGELGDIIKDDPDVFLTIAMDDDLTMKLFAQECIAESVIMKKGKNSYEIPGYEDRYNFIELIDFLSEAENQLVYAKLKAQLQVKK